MSQRARLYVQTPMKTCGICQYFEQTFVTYPDFGECQPRRRIVESTQDACECFRCAQEVIERLYAQIKTGDFTDWSDLKDVH